MELSELLALGDAPGLEIVEVGQLEPLEERTAEHRGELAQARRRRAGRGLRRSPRAPRARRRARRPGRRRRSPGRRGSAGCPRRRARAACSGSSAGPRAGRPRRPRTWRTAARAGGAARSPRGRREARGSSATAAGRPAGRRGWARTGRGGRGGAAPTTPCREKYHADWIGCPWKGAPPAWRPASASAASAPRSDRAWSLSRPVPCASRSCRLWCRKVAPVPRRDGAVARQDEGERGANGTPPRSTGCVRRTASRGPGSGRPRGSCACRGRSRTRARCRSCQHVVQLARVDLQAVLVADVDGDRAVLPQVADVLIDEGQRRVGRPLAPSTSGCVRRPDRQVEIERRVLRIGRPRGRRRQLRRGRRAASPSRRAS